MSAYTCIYIRPWEWRAGLVDLLKTPSPAAVVIRTSGEPSAVPWCPPGRSAGAPAMSNLEEVARRYSETYAWDAATYERDFPAELNVLIEEVGRTGRLRVEWKVLKALLAGKMVATVLMLSIEDGNSSSWEGGETLQQHLRRLQNALYSFETTPPFTIQRLCEILANPRKWSGDSTKKYIRCLVKVVSVTSS